MCFILKQTLYRQVQRQRGKSYRVSQEDPKSLYPLDASLLEFKQALLVHNTQAYR